MRFISLFLLLVAVGCVFLTIIGKYMPAIAGFLYVIFCILVQIYIQLVKLNERLG